MLEIIKMQERINYLYERCRKIKFEKHFILLLFIPLVLLFIIEGFHRGAIQTIDFIITHKATAFLNYLLLLMLVSLATFSKRMPFMALLMGLPWCILAGISGILIKFRGVPLICADFYSVDDGLAVARQYFSKAILFKLGIWIFISVLLLRLCYIVSSKRDSINFTKRLTAFIVIIILGSLGSTYFMKARISEKPFEDINSFYKHNGFVYSFGTSYLRTFNRLTIKPSEHMSKDMINDIINDRITNKDVELDSNKPNIIIIQVEALFDPMSIKGISVNEDPIPNIRKYMHEGYSGLIQVPTLGGSTARTEFEVLTGMTLDYFSPGEIPYNSGVISKGPIETIAYLLKNVNYYTTAIHNFQGNFYSRNKELKNLGFDRFIPMESMNGLVKQGEFPEDGILLNYIEDTLEITKERDFIFTITAGSHGPYSKTLNPENEKYAQGNLSQEALYQLQNYISLIRKTDRFIGELVEYIYTFKEPIILAVYSDHYPMLEVVDKLSYEEKYNCMYFIIDNKNKLPRTKDNHIEAYQLSTDLLNLCGIKGGVMNVFHTIYRDEEDYQKNLEQIQNIVLYGKEDSLNNKNLYTPTDMEIGLTKIEVQRVMLLEDMIILNGTGFTKSSKIFLDHTPVETKFMNEHTLVGELPSRRPKFLEVKYLGRHDEPILSSNIYLIKEENKE